MNGLLTIAIVGLGFGQDFVPLYLSHPGVGRVVLVEPDEERRRQVAERFGLEPGVADAAAVLADPSVDAVHVLSPVHTHADIATAALEAGKHIASAVPMATTLEDLDRIIAAEDGSRGRYTMMETALFGREHLAVRAMHGRGELGSLTLYRGFHIQNLDGFPAYWQGYPPMHYATHALSPVLDLLGTTVSSVRCLGAGRLAEHRRAGAFDNPFPTEVGLFSLHGSDVLAEVTVSFSQTARTYIEGFSLYGERRGLEWPGDNEGPLAVFDMTTPAPGVRGNPVETTAFDPPDVTDTLPEPLRPFVRRSVFDPGGDLGRVVVVEAHHGGSHPHLVHEFVSSILEDRPSRIDARRAAQLTAPGICAHRSALQGGAASTVPAYARTDRRAS